MDRKKAGAWCSIAAVGLMAWAATPAHSATQWLTYWADRDIAHAVVASSAGGGKNQGGNVEMTRSGFNGYGSTIHGRTRGDGSGYIYGSGSVGGRSVLTFYHVAAGPTHSQCWWTFPGAPGGNVGLICKRERVL